MVPACIKGFGTLGTDRETGGEDRDSRKQLGPKNMQNNPRRKMKELREEIGMKKTPKDENSWKQNVLPVQIPFN